MMNANSAAQRGMIVNMNMAAQPRAVGNFHVGSDDAEWTDVDGLADFGGRIDQGVLGNRCRHVSVATLICGARPLFRLPKATPEPSPHSSDVRCDAPARCQSNR